MAGDLKPENELLPAAAEPVTEPGSDVDPAEEAPPYQSRFQLVLGVLLGIGMAAVAATAIFLMTDTEQPRESTVRWSAWSPNAKTADGAVRQIATHVGRQYSLPSGNQLVAVRGGNLELGGLPVTVALRRSTQSGGDGSIDVVEGRGVLYTLCGLGKDCAIKEGKKSVARHLVLRREALELALYTFRYIDNTDLVVAMLPPAPGDKPTQAMFFRRKELAPNVDRPLSQTLAGSPPEINKLREGEANFLDQLTTKNLFAFSLVQGQDPRVILVLQR